MVLAIGFLLMVSLVLSAALAALGKLVGTAVRRLARRWRSVVNIAVGFGSSRRSPSR